MGGPRPGRSILEETRDAATFPASGAWWTERWPFPCRFLEPQAVRVVFCCHASVREGVATARRRLPERAWAQACSYEGI